MEYSYTLSDPLHRAVILSFQLKIPCICLCFRVLRTRGGRRQAGQPTDGGAHYLPAAVITLYYRDSTRIPLRNVTHSPWSRAASPTTDKTLRVAERNLKNIKRNFTSSFPDKFVSSALFSWLSNGSHSWGGGGYTDESTGKWSLTWFFSSCFPAAACSFSCSIAFSFCEIKYREGERRKVTF